MPVAPLKLLAQGLKAAPLTSVAVGAGALSLLAPIGNSIKDAFSEQDDVTKQLREEMEAASKRRAFEVRQRRYEAKVKKNTLRLMERDPHTYQEVMAGRRLARGSIIVGGAPRMDLMEMLAANMGPPEQKE